MTPPLQTIADALAFLGYGRPGVEIDVAVGWALVELHWLRAERSSLYMDLLTAHGEHQQTAHGHPTGR